MCCDFVAFLNSGVIRHYHIKNGNEITCDITLQGNFITDFKSLTQNTPSNYNFQITPVQNVCCRKIVSLFGAESRIKNSSFED
jgi:hypothetical protein